MAFYFSSVTKALYDTDVFPVASLPENKVEITEAAYTDLMTKQNQGYVILADGSGNPYTVNQSESTATDIKHAASVASTIALGHVKIGNTMTTANDGSLDVKDDAITANKVKDGETLPVNISGQAGSIASLESITQKNNSESRLPMYEEEDSHWLKIATIERTDYNSWGSVTLLVDSNFYGNQHYSSDIITIMLTNPSTSDATLFRVNGRRTRLINSDRRFFVNKVYDSSGNVTKVDLYTYVQGGNAYGMWSGSVLCATNCYVEWKWMPNQTSVLSIATEILPVVINVGSPSNPVYVDSNGQVQPCDASHFIIDKIVNEDGTDIGFSKQISFAEGYQEGYKTIGKLNISPSNKNCIIDITFLMKSFDELKENDDSDEIPAATFAVFVGNTEISSFYLHGSINHLDDNYSPYSSSPSFRCTFSANINNTIYIKVKKSSYYARKLDLFDIKIQGLAFYKD